MSEDALPGDTDIYLLKNGEEQGWDFRSGKYKNVKKNPKIIIYIY